MRRNPNRLRSQLRCHVLEKPGCPSRLDEMHQVLKSLVRSE
jgi:hypothetical protein